MRPARGRETSTDSGVTRTPHSLRGRKRKKPTPIAAQRPNESPARRISRGDWLCANPMTAHTVSASATTHDPSRKRLSRSGW